MSLKLDPNGSSGGGSAGASPTSTGSSTGASGASPNPTPSSSPSSETTKKIDYGMSSKPESNSNISSDISDDELFSKYGKRIFEHDRFKELTGFKKQYQDVKPIQDFVEKVGGFEAVQQFYTYFGPVWNHLMSQGESTGSAWKKLYPVLQAFLEGKDFPTAASKEASVNPAPPEDDDPILAKVRPLEEKLSKVEKNLSDRDLAEKNANIRRDRENMVLRYSKEFEGKLESIAKKIGISEMTPNSKKLSAELVINHIIKFMPKDASGRSLNPLDHYSVEALDQVLENTVVPYLKGLRTEFLDQTKKIHGEGSPTLPDTSRGAAGKSFAPTSLKDKAARFAQGITRVRA